SYNDLLNAHADAEALTARGVREVYIQVDEVRATPVYRVLVGAYPDPQSAARTVPALRALGYEGFVKKHQQHED
ncbi:MAG: SPOR domain-containing protein, partial [Catalinimonas sp.]